MRRAIAVLATAFFVVTLGAPAFADSTRNPSDRGVAAMRDRDDHRGGHDRADHGDRRGDRDDHRGDRDDRGFRHSGDDDHDGYYRHHYGYYGYGYPYYYDGYYDGYNGDYYRRCRWAYYNDRYYFDRYCRYNGYGDGYGYYRSYAATDAPQMTAPVAQPAPVADTTPAAETTPAPDQTITVPENPAPASAAEMATAPAMPDPPGQGLAHYDAEAHEDGATLF